jgi:hypothetical protein
MCGVMKKCCGRCPYSKKNTLFVHPNRAQDFANEADNPYSDFVCHKTGVTLEDVGNGDGREGEIVRGENSLTCAGFHVMQNLLKGWVSKIEVDFADHFDDIDEMVDHHDDEYQIKRN